jgi:hypothetical protein
MQPQLMWGHPPSAVQRRRSQAPPPRASTESPGNEIPSNPTPHSLIIHRVPSPTNWQQTMWRRALRPSRRSEARRNSPNPQTLVHSDEARAPRRNLDNRPCGDGRFARPAEAKQGGLTQPPIPCHSDEARAPRRNLDNRPCGDGRLAHPAEAKQGGTHPTPNPLSFRRSASPKEESRQQTMWRRALRPSRRSEARRNSPNPQTLIIPTRRKAPRRNLLSAPTTALGINRVTPPHTFPLTTKIRPNPLRRTR